MRISFFASGEPKGQPRPKATIRGRHASVYDPGTANDWKLQVAIAAKPHIPATPLDCPLDIELEFFMPRPKAHWRSGKYSHVLRDDAPELHTCAPDCDNLAKAVLDQLTQCLFWRDDCVVARLLVVKRYEASAIGCRIGIESLAPDAGGGREEGE